MALDAAVEGLMQQSELGHHSRSLNLIGVIDRNLVQVGGIVNEQAVAQTVLSSDDATIFAALNTASRIPRSGAIAD